MTARETSVSLTDLDRVLAAVARHQADCIAHGDLDSAARDQQRLDAYLDHRLRLTTEAAA